MALSNDGERLYVAEVGWRTSLIVSVVAAAAAAALAAVFSVPVQLQL